mgnify:CR=1 FL=1
MKVTSTGIIDGVIQDIYGKRSRHIKMGMPTYSLPIKIEEYEESIFIPSFLSSL